MKILKPFNEMPQSMVRAFNALISVDRHAFSQYRHLKEHISSDTGIARANRRVKKAQKKGIIDRTAYAQLRRGRATRSGLEELLSKSAFRTLLYAPTGGIRNTKSGLYAELRRFDGGYLLCFPGSGAAGNLDTQWRMNLKQALGQGVPRVYLEAAALAQELRAVLPEGVPLAVAGHSMGGGIANFVGLALGMDSYCFNAAALGEKSLAYLKQNDCLTGESIAKQKHARMKADFASGSSLMKAARHLGGQKIMPTLVGLVYQCAPGGHQLSHMASLMAQRSAAIKGQSAAAAGVRTVPTAAARVPAKSESTFAAPADPTESSDGESDTFYSLDDNSDDEYTSARDEE